MAERLKIKVQIRQGEGFAMGPGKAALLEAIDREGSIAAAGRALGMSYRRAWLLADEMNHSFTHPLITTLRGGGRERGTRLTETGRDVLGAFRLLERRAGRIAHDPAYATLVASLRDDAGTTPD